MNDGIASHETKLQSRLAVHEDIIQQWAYVIGIRKPPPVYIQSVNRLRCGPVESGEATHERYQISPHSVRQLSQSVESSTFRSLFLQIIVNHQ
jgi:hypothetical protein